MLKGEGGKYARPEGVAKNSKERRGVLSAVRRGCRTLAQQVSEKKKKKCASAKLAKGIVREEGQVSAVVRETPPINTKEENRWGGGP